MPKEATYGLSNPSYVDGEEVSQPVAEVRWERAPVSHVQVVTRVLDAEPVRVSAPDGGLEKFEVTSGKEFVRCSASGTGGDFQETEWSICSAEEGYYVSLDRDGINRLIRNLKRARDQAFGKDE